jgi:hypothetical protein
MFGYFELPLGGTSFVRVTVNPDVKNVTSDLRVANPISDGDYSWNDGVSGIEFLVMNLFAQGVDVINSPQIITAIEDTLDGLNDYCYNG